MARRSTSGLAPAARARYSRLARGYDNGWPLRVVRGIQERAVARLGLGAGARVVDVACGTGINFAALERRIGPAGRLVGVDVTPAMLAVAEARVREHGWRNVDLVASAVERAELPRDLDAALFSFAHEVLRTPAAVERTVDALRPGASVVACGMKWAPRWNVPVNAAVALATRPFFTTRDGLAAPWSHLAARLVDVRVEQAWLGSVYLFHGRRA